MKVLYNLKNFEEEEGFYITSDRKLSPYEIEVINFLVDGKLSYKSEIKKNLNHTEIGPLPNFKSPWCSNALSILKRCGIEFEKIEKTNIIKGENIIFDEMTSINYKNMKEDFSDKAFIRRNPYPVPLFKLKKFNEDNNLGFDESDISFYKSLFNYYKRSPTDVELFDLAQSNSEHSRHWFFNGQLIIRDELTRNVEIVGKTLMNLIKETYKPVSNSLIYLKDNASVIKGFKILTIVPKNPEKSSEYIQKHIDYDIAFTAETHNFPTGIAPFPGAATGTGGRIRDNQAVGRGGLIIAGIVGYCVGNLNIPYYDLPWEDNEMNINSVKTPLEIEIKASDGASDYGNKIGEPIILGFTRSFGMTLPSRQRVEWLKPIMFSGGIGMIDRNHIEKYKPQSEMLIVRLGGPAYRIGMGGGAASSKCQGETVDYNAVQRGDPEMENKLSRVIRSCIDMGEKNPILSIHDQGAGGMANVTKEIASPKGAFININNVVSGDDTLTFLEKWVSEYQEQITILTNVQNLDMLKKITKRENCPMSIAGYITNSGRIEVYDSTSKNYNLPVNLDLENILENVPSKKFILNKSIRFTQPFSLPEDSSITFMSLLTRVFNLLSVGSKRFLTNKVDRSVTGLIAQQQCVGPLHTPLSDMAVVAQSHYTHTGIASSVGEQPIKGLISSDAMARISVGEMLTNLMWVVISDFDDIKCAGNWMWPGKTQYEGYYLYTAVQSFTNIIKELGLGIDGGKDSLSMAVKCKDKMVNSPGSLVVSGYAPVPDIRKKVTPDFKKAGNHIIFVDLSGGENRMGGSALAQVFKQVGDNSPDVENPKKIKDIFNIVQTLIKQKLIISGHDRSDGGLITTILEMCFAGDKGCSIDITTHNIIESMFSEELGIILEVEDYIKFIKYFDPYPVYYLGKVLQEKSIKILFNQEIIFNEKLNTIRNIWEDTSYHLEIEQIGERYATEEKLNLGLYPKFTCNEKIINEINTFKKKDDKFNVAIMREEGSNGDKEMASAFEMAGFRVWDVNMNDLSNDSNCLDKFNGIAFVGGFSYSDVFGAATGWHASIMFNENIKKQFTKFYERKDTFSLGVCNGCQLMSKLKWIPECKFVKNNTKRFESRFSTVKVGKTNSIMLKDMEDSALGIWVAHGEGKCEIRNYKSENICLNYVDNENKSTERYPFNPNGSVDGITGICSDDGRHLAMMPHPERCFLKWQMPYIGDYLDEIRNDFSPWFMMFINTYQWCEKL